MDTIPYSRGGRELCVTGSCILTASEDWLGKTIRFFEGAHAFCSHAAPVVRFPVPFVERERVTLIESLEHGPSATYLSHYFDGSFKGRIFLFTPRGLTPGIQDRFGACLMDMVLRRVGYGYRQIVQQVAGHIEEGDGATLICSDEAGVAWTKSGLPRRSDAPQNMIPQPPDIPSWWDGHVVELEGPFA